MHVILKENTILVYFTWKFSLIRREFYIKCNSCGLGSLAHKKYKNISCKYFFLWRKIYILKECVTSCKRTIPFQGYKLIFPNTLGHCYRYKSVTIYTVLVSLKLGTLLKLLNSQILIFSSRWVMFKKKAASEILPLVCQILICHSCLR